MKMYTITVTEKQRKALTKVLATCDLLDNPRCKKSEHKNITCFHYPSFEGFRVSIQKKGFTFMRYFPCLKYAGWEGAEQAALKERDELKALLADKDEAEVYQLFLEYRDKHARRA